MDKKINDDVKPINKTIKDPTENDYERNEWKKNSVKANILNKTEEANKKKTRRLADLLFTTTASLLHSESH